MLYSWPVLLVAAIVTTLLARGAFGVMMIERGSAKKVRDLEAEAVLLTGREKELETEIAQLKTPEGIVDEIKDKFSVTRPGEHVAIIVDERSRASTTKKEAGIWYRRWWDAIIKPK